MTKRYSSALREPIRREIEALGEADILVGIPCYYSEDTIAHVLKTILKGLALHFPDKKAVVIVSDGGSTDDTREVAEKIEVTHFGIQKFVLIYRGLPGKGSAFRAIFEISAFLNVHAVAVFDSDLHSINDMWIKNVLTPIFEGYDYVAPDYVRHKYDGTITNTIAYMLIKGLYGVNIRQPIGGDFGISQKLVRHYVSLDVWETDIARFGIDIWMTATAIVDNFSVCQARLGVKIHGKKDPTADLSPMFRQVVGTFFMLLDDHYHFWASNGEMREVPTFGHIASHAPETIPINTSALVEYFKTGFANFGSVWATILDEQDFAIVETNALAKEGISIELPIETWVRIVYSYAIAFKRTPYQRFKLLDTMIPLYYARVASIVTALESISDEGAERFFAEQAQTFFAMKSYLKEKWDQRKE